MSTSKEEYARGRGRDYYYDPITDTVVKRVEPIPAPAPATEASPVAEVEKPAPIDGAPEWVRMLDPERQARMFEKNEYGWYRWTDCNPAVELLIQLLTDLRNDRPARPGRHRIEP